MTAVYYALSCVLGYLLGSISISILISRHVFHQDVRQSGSGNAGATNVARVFGLGAGVLTFLGDFAKTLLAAWLGSRFRGGKAVSAGAAAALVIDWRIFVLAIAVFALAALLSKTASVSSMSAAGMVAVGTLLFAPSTAQLLLGLFTCTLVLFMHRSNIRRLIAGTEPKFHPGHRHGK